MTYNYPKFSFWKRNADFRVKMFSRKSFTCDHHHHQGRRWSGKTQGRTTEKPPTLQLNISSSNQTSTAESQSSYLPITNFPDFFSLLCEEVGTGPTWTSFFTLLLMSMQASLSPTYFMLSQSLTKLQTEL